METKHRYVFTAKTLISNMTDNSCFPTPAFNCWIHNFLMLRFLCLRPTHAHCHDFFLICLLLFWNSDWHVHGSLSLGVLLIYALFVHFYSDLQNYFWMEGYIFMCSRKHMWMFKIRTCGNSFLCNVNRFLPSY